MERVGEWRLIDSDDEAEPKPPERTEEESPPGAGMRSLLLAIGAVILAGVGLAIWLTMPQGGVRLDVAGQAGQAEVALQTGAPDASAVAGAVEPELVVDVQGAVARPGVHRLPAGSRVGDGIAAAGGYSAQVDIAAAAERLNLAERLTDGAKIRVPVRGEAAAAPLPEGSAESSGSIRLIDINRASAGELDTLPGIGPVTAQKIIDARAEAPFSTVDELLSRGVVGPSTFDKLRDLVTVSS